MFRQIVLNRNSKCNARHATIISATLNPKNKNHLSIGIDHTYNVD